MKFTKKVLDNGLTILHERREVPVTTVMLAVKHGGANEKEEEKGMSHYMEHLCFKGTKKRPLKEEIAGEIEKKGGIINAFTTEESTAYFTKLPSEHLEIAMDVIFDIFFNPTFPEEEIEREGNVIIEEMKMIEDNPARYIHDKLQESLYEPPFGMGIIGTRKGIKSMTREQLLKKHRKTYFPANSILVVVGNNNFSDVLELAKKFVVERNGEADPVPEIKLKNEDGYLKRKDNNQTNIVLGVHFPKGSEKERYAAELFSAILGKGMSSKLFLEVREKRGLVYTIKSDIDLKKRFGYFVIYAGTDPSKSDEVIKVCKEEFAKMKKITQKELDEAKVQLIGNRHIASEGCDEVAVELLFEEIIGDAKDYYDYEKRINAVILEDIKELAKKEDFSTFIIGP